MERIDTLRQQASILRKLADSFDTREIKEDLLSLADRCDLLAAQALRQISDQLPGPVADLAKKTQPQAD